MRPLDLLVIVSAAVALTTRTQEDLTDLEDAASGQSIPECSDGLSLDAMDMDQVVDAVLNGDDTNTLNVAGETSTTNSSVSTPPKLLKIGFGYHWKKGLKHWVAFPMLGLLACKKSQDLGRMSAGKEHTACQKSFEVMGKWYQLDGCNAVTGMPKYLLDGEGYAIASCGKKTSKILCMKEGKIHGKGSCEGPPPSNWATLRPDTVDEEGELVDRGLEDEKDSQ